MNRAVRTLVCGFAVLGTGASAAAAQQPDPPPYRQVISANPFGLLLDVFNAEYERIISESATAGIGGSTISDAGDRYVNADVFWRFYPGGMPLNGWAFGAKVGITHVDGGTYFGYGFDVNRSWIMGRNDNFYVGIGIGLKRLVGTPDDEPDSFDWNYVPTLRLVNIGFAF
jgi:hypothetical protein